MYGAHAGYGQAHARLMFQSSAGITDACMAILIMDSTAPHPLLGCNENPVDEVRSQGGAERITSQRSQRRRRIGPRLVHYVDVAGSGHLGFAPNVAKRSNWSVQAPTCCLPQL